MLRFIIVGLGARAQYWMRVLNANPECAIVGLIDPIEANRQRALEKCPGARASADLSLIGAIEADAVLLCTPPAGRDAQIEACLSARVAILAEKPLADSIEAAERFTLMAEEAGVPLMVGLNFRYLDVTRETLALFATTVGAPSFSRFTYERWRDGYQPHLNKYPLTMAQPMLWEQSIHHLDLMRFVMGEEPVSIYARTFNPPWSMYADDANVSAIITFPKGQVIEYQGLWQSNWKVPHFEWRHECERGVVLQKEQFGELFYALRDDDAPRPVTLPPHEQWINDAVALLCAFVDALKGRAALQCSARDHLNSLRMVEACIRSSKTGEAVFLTETEPRGVF